MEVLNIADVVVTCDNYLENYDNPEYEKKFNDLKEKLVVRDYLLLEQKQIALRKIFMDVDLVIDSSYDFAVWLELILLFDGLLSYTNIDPNIDQIWKIAEAYDIICESGLADYIKQYCKSDYTRLVHMVENMFSWKYISEMSNMVENMNTTSIEELTKEFQRVSDIKNSQYIREMGNILGYNDPVMKQVKEGIESAAYETISKSSSGDENTEQNQ